ncbi:hypothetical protein EMPG_09630 [Blastomyces silverae]|uniref:Sialidase domain-containing protein n=1 Tax=Blastomyces silverae TaxID=2060906 RepID=A0A0H1BKD9_9EURO|nr:hypothetical protein EMPG_09630 [Blastomyces silverae]
MIRQVSKLMQFGLAALSQFRFGHSRPLVASCDDNAWGEIVIGAERSISDLPASYVRLAKLSDGSVLAGFTTNEDGVKVLKVSRSTDGGQQFSPFGEIARGDWDIGNLYLLEVAPSIVLGAFRNHTNVGPNIRHSRITVCKSADGGKNWKFASQAFEMEGSLGAWEPFMRLAENNPHEIQLTYSQEFAVNDQRTMLVRSTNQGDTWSTPITVSWQENHRDGMNGIARTKDGDQDALVMVFETTDNAPFFNVKAAISYDDGASWGHRQDVQVAPRGKNAGAPQIASFADGSLAVVYMSDEEIDGNWPFKANIKATFSGPPKDGKMHWSPPQLVKEANAFWPGALRLEDNMVMATYDASGPRAKPLRLNL